MVHFIKYIYIYSSKYASPRYHTRSSSNKLNHTCGVHCCCLKRCPPLFRVCHLPRSGVILFYLLFSSHSQVLQATAQFGIDHARSSTGQLVSCSLCNQPFSARQSLWASNHGSGSSATVDCKKAALKGARNDAAPD